MRVCIQADLDLLSLTFDKLIPQELVDHYRHRIMNVHPALLPAFKGRHAFEQALSAGACFTGATIHEVDETMDGGPIIAQCVLALRRHETHSQLGARLFGMLRLMYLQVLKWFRDDRVYHDADGRVWVRDAFYGELPVCPAIEEAFPE